MKPTEEMAKAAAEAVWRNPTADGIEMYKRSLTAAMPLIERAVAEQIAQKLEEIAELEPFFEGDQYYRRAANHVRDYAKGQNDD